MTHVATEDEGTAETATGGESGTGRLEAFSDAIISIAAALLVLDLKVPDTRDLARSLVHLWPAYLAFAVSFLITGVVWLNHHTMFRFIVRMDRMLMLLNLLLLMSVAFLPFPTEVLAEALSTHQGVRAAAVLYGAALVSAAWCSTRCGSTPRQATDTSARTSPPPRRGRCGGGSRSVRWATSSARWSRWSPRTRGC